MSDITLLGFDPAGIGKERDKMKTLKNMSGEELLDAILHTAAGDLSIEQWRRIKLRLADRRSEMLRRLALAERAEKAEALAAESIEAIKAAFGVLDMAEVGYAATLMGRMQLLVNWRNSLKYGFEETAKSLTLAEILAAQEHEKAEGYRLSQEGIVAEVVNERKRADDLKIDLETARTALQDEAESCAAAICFWCRNSLIAEPATRWPNIDKWEHVMKEGRSKQHCVAGPIHERIRAALTLSEATTSEKAGALSAETATEPRKETL